ncbi:hypothetical protein ACVWW2_008463 [Bradyrhizobium sp. LM4.3]
MSYPTKYTRQYDYVSYQNGNPSRPLPATSVHADLNQVALSVAETIDFLKKSLRSDGAVMNGAIGLDQLSEAIKAGMGDASAVQEILDQIDAVDASAVAAATSATNASTDATAASSSATAASSSASAATTSATNASNSATAASASATGAATSATNAATSATQAQSFSGIPQVIKSAAYTTILTDAQKHILHPASDNTARIFTIDSNANVAYPIGTALTFVNEINTVTIAITF